MTHDYDTSDARDRLLKAWESWDAAPGNEHRARALEDATRDYAGNMSLAFRQFIVKSRRDGATRIQTLDAWETDW